MWFFKRKKKDYTFEDGSYPIISNSYTPIIKATVQGESFYFLLDTGATISVFDENVFSKKFIKEYKVFNTNTNIVGYGGKLKSLKFIYGFEVKAGIVSFDRKWNLQDLSNIIKTVKTVTGYDIAGIIGNNNLRYQKIIIDFNKNLLKK